MRKERLHIKKLEKKDYIYMCCLQKLEKCTAFALFVSPEAGSYIYIKKWLT